MITVRKDPVEPAGDVIPGTYLRKGERSEETYDSAEDPRCKKDRRGCRFVGDIYRRTEDAHPNNKTHHDHGEIEKSKLRFNCHPLVIILIVFPFTLPSR